MEIVKNDLTAFIDESGSITKTDVEHNKYFIIAILFTRNSARIKRYFKKGIASLMQYAKYKELMAKNGEIKGSEVSERKKNKIYDRIIRNCKDDFEIGIIVLDNNYTTKEFIKNHARTFNYITQMFLDNSFRNCSKYRNSVFDMHLIIDEQNIATEAEYTLDGYLNQHLTVVNPLCNHFDVMYSDSKNHALIQLIDFISNTYYRNIEKHDRTSIQNIKLFNDILCSGRIFDFSTDHNTKIFLVE